MAVMQQLLTAPEEGWSRINDNHPFFVYEGFDWVLNNSSGACWQGTQSYMNIYKRRGAIRFKFYGTKLRLVQSCGSNYADNTLISIDGGTPEKLNTYTPDYTYKKQVLVYEKTGLDRKVHEVVMLPGTTQKYGLEMDALDIDDDGYLVPMKQSVLTTPQTGWDAFTVEDIHRVLKGEWTELANEVYAKGVHNVETSVKFFFTGTDLRLTGRHSSSCGNIKITLDGKEYQSDQKYQETSHTYKELADTMFFEVYGLEDKVHEVVIEPEVGNYVVLRKAHVKEGENLIALDGFDYVGQGLEFIPPTDPNILYYGVNWAFYNETDPATFRAQNNTDAKSKRIIMDVEATDIVLIGRDYSSFSKNLEVYLDGELLNRVDTSDGAGYHHVLAEAHGLSPGKHRIEITDKDMLGMSFMGLHVNPGGKTVDTGLSGNTNTRPVKLTAPSPGYRRFDNEFPGITFGGTGWSRVSDVLAGNYSNDIRKIPAEGRDAWVKFTFYGSKVRLIQNVGADYATDATITIDGVTEPILMNDPDIVGKQSQTIVYDKEGLEKAFHEVTINCGTDMPYGIEFDAVDLDEDGFILRPMRVSAAVAVETTWARHNADNNANIMFVGQNWVAESVSGEYHTNSKYLNTVSSEQHVRFGFKGTKLRLINSHWSDYTDELMVFIDGECVGVGNMKLSSNYRQQFTFEIQNLEDKEHEVYLVSRYQARWDFDALEIDADGFLFGVTPKFHQVAVKEKLPDKVRGISYYHPSLGGSARVTDVMVGKHAAYVCHGCLDYITPYAINADGSLGANLTGRLHWGGRDSRIDQLSNLNSSVPYSYAVFHWDGYDHLVGWTKSYSQLYCWKIDPDTYYIDKDSFEVYSVCPSVQTTYSRAFWDGGKYVYFWHRGSNKIWQWDITDRHKPMAQVAQIKNEQGMQSSYTGSGMWFDVTTGTMYWGDGANESQGAWGAATQEDIFGAYYQDQIRNPNFVPKANIGNVPGTTTGTLQMNALHPNMMHGMRWGESLVHHYDVDNEHGFIIKPESVSYTQTVHKEPVLIDFTFDSPYNNKYAQQKTWVKLYMRPQGETAWKYIPQPNGDPIVKHMDGVNLQIPGDEFIALGKHEVEIELINEMGRKYIHIFVDVVNDPPVVSLTVDNDTVHDENVNVAISITGELGDKASYQMLLNGEVKYDWSESEYVLPAFFLKSIRPWEMQIGTNIVEVNVREKFGLQTLEASGAVSFTKDNQAPTVQAEIHGHSMKIAIDDPDGDQIQFRVLVNEKQAVPAAGFSSVFDVPFETEYTLPYDLLNIGQNNTIKVEARDQAGDSTVWSESRLIRYAGLMFRDEYGVFYTTDIGEMLRYLDMGTVVATLPSEVKQVHLENTYGFPVRNIKLDVDQGDLDPVHETVEISKTKDPFIPESHLEFTGLQNPGDDVVFYLRITTDYEAIGGGEFKVLAEADPVWHLGAIE